PRASRVQVALSGRCKGKPEDIEQIFLTEAVQAIAAGDAKRLGEFLEAGVDASSKYGGLSAGRRRGGESCQGDGEEEEEQTGGSGVGRWGGGEALEDVSMFVEGLREAIVELTAESEELEKELSRRGTLSIIKRARATRQDLILAASEVETANALCDQWRAEEEAAAKENVQLQVCV
ncbi:unnamed protein product, partial [Hapterophycus canaliculatus]